MTETGSGTNDLSRRVTTYVIVIIVAAVALLGLVRVFIRPVSPAQENPPGHFGEPCVLCHIVTETAETIDFAD